MSGCLALANLKHIDLRIIYRDYSDTFTTWADSDTAHSINMELLESNRLSDTPWMLRQYFKLWLLYLDADPDRTNLIVEFPTLLARYDISVKLQDWHSLCYTTIRHDDREGCASYEYYVDVNLSLQDGSTTLNLKGIDRCGSFRHHGGNAALPTSNWMDDFHMIDPQGGWDKFEHTETRGLLDVLIFRLLAKRGLLGDLKELPCQHHGHCSNCEVVE